MKFRQPGFPALAAGVLFSAALAVGCGHPMQSKLEGRWLGEGVENFDDAQVAAATGWAKGASFEFAGSSLTIAIPAEDPRTGKYKIVKVHENDVDIAVARADGQSDRARLRLDDDRSLRWMVGEGRAVLMRKEN